MKTTNAKVYRAIKDINQINRDLDILSVKKSKAVELGNKTGNYKLWDFYQSALESNYSKLLVKEEKLRAIRKEDYENMEIDLTNPFCF